MKQPTPQPPPCREGVNARVASSGKADATELQTSFSPSLQGGGWGVGRFVLSLVALVSLAAPSFAAEKPNIVVILADDRDYSEGQPRYHTSNRLEIMRERSLVDVSGSGIWIELWTINYTGLHSGSRKAQTSWPEEGGVATRGVESDG